MRASIYMDHHATTPVDPRVLAAMLPYFSEEFGNAASLTHSFGRRAAQAVSSARERVATAIGATAGEIVFTSGATEADNLALLGVALACDRPGHMVTAKTEHRAVLDPSRRLEALGWGVTRLGVDSEGFVDPDDVRRALRENTILVSIMAANNEIGTLAPVREIASICHRSGILFHSDAVQLAGRIPIDVHELGVDLLSLSSHKVYGPKGVGALYVSGAIGEARLAPILYGAGGDRELRPGTPNVPGIVGMGEAFELAARDTVRESARLAGLVERLYRRIADSVGDLRLNGPRQGRLPGNLNLSFAGIEADALLTALDDVALSTGSACASSGSGPSHVLAAIGVGRAWIRGSIRFGLGRGNTESEVDEVASRIAREVERLRSLAPPPGARAVPGPVET